MLEIKLLGRFDLILDDQPVEIPLRSVQSLFAYLILNRDRSHRRERLAGLFWPDSSESNARSNLRHGLWRIRQAIGDSFLEADSHVISFEAKAPYSFDVEDFTKWSMEEGAQAQIDCLSHYQGELLPGFYDDWLLLERERIRAKFDQEAGKLLNSLIKAEEIELALGLGERWLALGQAPERCHRGLMRAHAMQGDHAAVAAVYERCHQVLKRELGVEPSAATEQLFKQLTDPTHNLAAVSSETALELNHSTGVEYLLAERLHHEKKALSLSDLAFIYATPERLNLGFEDFYQVLTSAAQSKLDLSPWLHHAQNDEVIVRALEKIWQGHPPVGVRLEVVESLKHVESGEAQLLLKIVAGEEESAAVRTEAALALSQLGFQQHAIQLQVDALDGHNRAIAIAAIAALSESMPIPLGDNTIPKLPLYSEIISQRWRKNKDDLLRLIIQGTLGAGLGVGVLGLLIPLLVALISPSSFYEMVSINEGLLAWTVSATVAALVWGSIQGFATTTLVALARAFVHYEAESIARVIAGAISGLAHSTLLILFSVSGLLLSPSPPSIYVPTYLIHGMAVGVIFSRVVPRFPEEPGDYFSLVDFVLGWLAAGLVSIISSLIVNKEVVATRLVTDMAFAFFVLVGMQVAFGKAGKGGRQSRISGLIGLH